MSTVPKKKKLTCFDADVYGSGEFGHNHIRGCLNTLLQWWNPVETAALRTALCGEMSDDASEEDDAIEYLNTNACDGCYFALSEGDLWLLKSDELDSAQQG